MSPRQIQVVNAFEVKIDGAALDARLVSALARSEVVQRLNAPATTVLTFHDTSTEGASVLELPNLAIGKKLEVQSGAGGDGSLTSIFKGEITAIEFEVEAGTSYVTVRAHDNLQRLYHGTKMATQLNMSYSDIVGSVARSAGLSIATLEPTSGAFEYLPQAWLSDGELLSRLAAEVGYVFYARDEKLHFKKPGWTTSSGVTVTHGEGLLRFRSSQTSEAAAGKVTVRGWDPKQKKAIVGTSAAVKSKGVKLPKDPTSTFPGNADLTVAGTSLPTRAAAEVFANAIADRIGDAASTADGLAHGDPNIVPDSTIKVDKVPKPVAGDYYVTEARHIFADGEYHTEFRCSGALGTDLWSATGGSSRELPALPQQQPHPFVVLPAIVTNNNYADGPKCPAVKVMLPTLDDTQESDWLRLVNLGAGADRGLLFVPEVNDEVLVAFAEGNLRTGYVLGGLYNGKDKPGKEMTATADVVAGGKVNRKGIISRSGHQVILDDKSGEERILIMDKTGKQQVLFTSKDSKILISSGDNTVLIDGQGNAVSVESNGDITMKAKGNLTLEATGNLKMKAGANSSLEAGASNTVKGMTTELNGSAQTTVKGGMVMIN